MPSCSSNWADANGEFSWAFPDEVVVASLIADAASVSTYLYGRRMYGTMAGWETDPSWAAGSPESANFAELWTRAEKVVFSHTLARERRFDNGMVQLSYERRRA